MIKHFISLLKVDSIKVLPCFRWREEAESEAARHQDKLQQVEREKMDAVLALKKKIDALEVSKTNEISRLQDIHR